MKLLIALVLVLMPLNLQAAEPLTLVTSSDQYSTSDSFQIKVKNPTNQKIAYTRIAIQALAGSSWRLIRRDISCPCGAMCKKLVPEVNPGETKTEKWDFKDDQCNPVKAGVYRAILAGEWDKDLDDNAVLAISKQFQIK